MTWTGTKRIGITLSLVASLIWLGAIALNGVGYNLSDWVGWLYFLIGLVIVSPFLIGAVISRLGTEKEPSPRVRVATYALGSILFAAVVALAIASDAIWTKGDAKLHFAGAIIVALPFLAASTAQLFQRR